MAMSPENRMKTGTCPCCRECKNCPGFQKLLDRPKSGYILYRHVTHVEDINKKTGIIEATTETIDDVYIIENTQDAELKKIDFTPEIDRNQIKCPRCAKILKHAQSLFHNQEIGKSDVIGVCSHCRKRSQGERSCLKCDEIVEKFQLSKSEKSERKQTHAHRVKTWLTKIQQLITVALDEGKDKKTGSSIRRGHSDIDINKLLRKVPKSDHEPEIEDLFLQKIRGLQTSMKGPVSERSYFPGAIREVAFYEPGETKPKYGTPEDVEVFQPLLHSQSNATLTGDELEKDFIRRYGKSYKERRSFEDPTAKVRYVDEKYNELIPSASKSYGDEDGKHYDVRGRKRENIQDSDSRHGGIKGKGHENEYIPDSDMRLEGVRRKKPITDSDSRHGGIKGKGHEDEYIPDSDMRLEGIRRKKPITDSDSRHGGIKGKGHEDEYIPDSDMRLEGVRRKKPITDSDSRHGGIKGKGHENEYIPDSDMRLEGVRRKMPITDFDSRHEGVRRKELVKESDSLHEGARRKELGPAASKYREDKDLIPAPKTRHEEEKKKAGIRHDEETPDEIKKRVTRDAKKDDFITVIGKRFEEEIEAKGLTLAPKKSHEAKKMKDLTTASETRLQRDKPKDMISTDKDHKIGKKAKSGTKILYESPSHIKKYHSDESLIAGISKMKEEVNKQKTFDVYFPEKPGGRKKKPKVGSVVSSEELLKDTIDKLQTKSSKAKSEKEKADKMKEERDKKLEEEKLDREKLLAEKLAAKLARDAEKEQREKEKDKEMASEQQDTSKKDQDASNKDQGTLKKEQEASKKDRDALKKDKDASKKKPDDEIIKEKTGKEKMDKERGKADKKEKEVEVDIAKIKIEKEKETKSKDDVPFIAAKNKAKEEKNIEDKTKDKKVKGKEVDITQKKGKEEKLKEEKLKEEKIKEEKPKEGTADKQTLTTNKRDPEAEKLLKQLEQEIKDREKMQNELRKQKEEEKRMKLAAAEKAKESASQPPGITRKRSKAKILDLIKLSKRPREIKKITDITPVEIKAHKGHRYIKNKKCDICLDSDMELDLQSLLRQKQEALKKKDAKEAVIGEAIHKFKTHMPEPNVKEEIKPALFQKQFETFGQELDSKHNLVQPGPEVKKINKGVSYH